MTTAPPHRLCVPARRPRPPSPHLLHPKLPLLSTSPLSSGATFDQNGIQGFITTYTLTTTDFSDPRTKPLTNETPASDDVHRSIERGRRRAPSSIPALHAFSAHVFALQQLVFLGSEELFRTTTANTPHDSKRVGWHCHGRRTLAPFVDEAGVARLATRVIMEYPSRNGNEPTNIFALLLCSDRSSLFTSDLATGRYPFWYLHAYWLRFGNQDLRQYIWLGLESMAASTPACNIFLVYTTSSNDIILLISFEHVEGGLRNLKSNRKRSAEAARTGTWIVHVIEDATSLRGGVPLRVVP
ncbi:hypothetical protein B0H11DRAFT_1909656 [Mycena galericulata]|nr:hypothetical protein B0H11DRAFT_1909656 [Mycena galericulata]